MLENEKKEADRPLTIAMVVDTSGNRGNGTSNSALQWAQELERQGHHVRLVGIGAPDFPARVNHVPLVSWVAKQQQMQFAEPSDTLFRAAFLGVDAVHIMCNRRTSPTPRGPLNTCLALTHLYIGCSICGCIAGSAMCTYLPSLAPVCCVRMGIRRNCT